MGPIAPRRPPRLLLALLLAGAGVAAPPAAPSGTEAEPAVTERAPDTSVPADTTAATVDATVPGMAVASLGGDDSANNTRTFKLRSLAVMLAAAGMLVCSAKDPQLDECFRELSERWARYLIPGRRDFNIPRMDPMDVLGVELLPGNDLVPELAFNLSDVQQLGWARSRPVSTRVRLNESSYELRWHFPRLQTLGRYRVHGSVLGFIPLDGSGPFHVDCYDSTFFVWVRWHLKQHAAGRRHMAVDNVRIVSRVNDCRFNVRNLFGNEALSDLTNDLINANSRLITETYFPTTDKLFAEIFKSLLQPFYNVVPFDSIISDVG